MEKLSMDNLPEKEVEVAPKCRACDNKATHLVYGANMCDEHYNAMIEKTRIYKYREQPR